MQKKHNRSPAHGAKRSKKGKTFALVIALLLILSFAAGGTLAYLAVKSASASNTFSSARVSCAVAPGGAISNTGSVDAYIRAAVIVNWVDGDGNVYAASPAYSVSIADGWVHKGAESDYYYYTASVAAGESIPAPAAVTVTGANPDASRYTARIEYLAEAIQAEGTTDDTDIPAYQDAWGISSISG